MAAVTLVDVDRQWFESRYGLAVSTNQQDDPLCRHVVETRTELVVDAAADTRFADTAFVQEQHVRCYVGIPLTTPDGVVLGSLCAIDTVPREVTDLQLQLLRDVGQQVVLMLERRRERVRIEVERAAAVDNEQQLRALLGAMQEGVVLQDAQGNIRASNPAAESMLGSALSMLMGRPSTDSRWRCLRDDNTPFPPHEYPSLVTMATGTSCGSVIMGVERPAGSGVAVTWVSINAQPLFRPGEAKPWAVVATFHDITAQREAERARARIAQQERLLTTGTLAAGVGHEINNPLAYVSSNIELALEDLQATLTEQPNERLEGVVEALRDAEVGAQRIRRIVRGLRALAREERDPVATDCLEVIELSLSMSMHELRHKATVTVDAHNVPPVLADDSRLSQVLVNLLTNAGQAFETADPERTSVVISAFATSATRVGIVVSDNGPGVPPDVLPRVFDPFFTTKPVNTGTGLGLSISHSIISALGGTITCRSEPGEGTSFEIILPAATTARAPSLVLPPVQQPHARGRILVVDDDSSVLVVIARVLHGLHDVVARDDARDALDLIEGGERYDLVLCDLTMPHLDGTELYERVRSIDPAQASRFVFITGAVVDSDAAARLASLGNERLDKPFTNEQLRDVARRAARQRGDS
jgi:signal transduction histidine kinase